MGSQQGKDTKDKSKSNPNTDWHDSDGLNIETKEYEENRRDGLMICGMNWGGDPDEILIQTSDQKDGTFFSDIHGLPKRYIYKEKIVAWFDLIGHPLKTQRGQEGKFEKSLLQTNWLNSKSKGVNPKTFLNDCVNAWDNFLFRLTHLKPKVIMLFNPTMLEALNLCVTKEHMHEFFGKFQQPYYPEPKVQAVAGRPDKHKIGVQRFGNVDVIALPHPNTMPENDYIKAFKDDLYPIIAEYKTKRGF